MAQPPSKKPTAAKPAPNPRALVPQKAPLAAAKPTSPGKAPAAGSGKTPLARAAKPPSPRKAPAAGKTPLARAAKPSSPRKAPAAGKTPLALAAKPSSPREARSAAGGKTPLAGAARPSSLRPAPPAAAEKPGRPLMVELDPARLEQTLSSLKEELVHWANKGRYTRVRFKFRGKPLLPDLPLAAVAAAEGLTFYWGGILRALIVNLAGKTVFEVELVNDSEKRVQQGKQALLAGDLEGALSHFKEAVSMDRDSAAAHLNLGVALRLSGDPASARKALERARVLAGDGPLSAEVERALRTLPTPTVEPVPPT